MKLEGLRNPRIAKNLSRFPRASSKPIDGNQIFELWIRAAHVFILSTPCPQKDFRCGTMCDQVPEVRERLDYIKNIKKRRINNILFTLSSGLVD